MGLKVPPWAAPATGVSSGTKAHLAVDRLCLLQPALLKPLFPTPIREADSLWELSAPGRAN